MCSHTPCPLPCPLPCAPLPSFPSLRPPLLFSLSSILDLAYSELSNLSETIFRDLTNLRYLDLLQGEGGNKLRSLPETIFNGLNRLENLVLSGLSNLPETIFRGLTSLR